MRKDYYNMQQITVLHQEIDNNYTHEMVYLIFVTVLQKASRKRAIFFFFYCFDTNSISLGIQTTWHLKTSRSRNKIVAPQILPKLNEWIYFPILNSIVRIEKHICSFCFLGEFVCFQFSFEIYWPLAISKIDSHYSFVELHYYATFPLCNTKIEHFWPFSMSQYAFLRIY